MHGGDPTIQPNSVPAPGRKPRRSPPHLPDIDPARCTGCGRCVGACEPHVLSLEPVRWVKIAVLHDRPGCTGCSRCAWVCPFRAITMRTGPREPGAGA